MQVSKIITSYGVLKNPSSIVTEMVLINPYNAKFFIEKPFENFCKKAAQDKEFRNSIRFIHKGRKITIDESIKELKSNKLENFKKEISESCFCDSNGLLQGLKKAKSLIKL